MEPQFAARCSPKGCLAADCGRTGACGRGFPASRKLAMVRAPRDDDAAQTLGDDRISCFYTLSSPWAYLPPAAAGRRAAPPRSASAEALRLPGRGAADRRRADPDAAEAAARLSRGRARPLAPAPRHAVEPDAALLSDGGSGAGLEQTRRPHGDRRASGRRGPFPDAHALLRALWAEERDIADPRVRGAIAGDRTGSISSIAPSTGCAGQRLGAEQRTGNRRFVEALSSRARPSGGGNAR